MICWSKFEKRIGMSLTCNGQAIFFIPYPPQHHIPGIPSKYRVLPDKPNNNRGKMGNC